MNLANAQYSSGLATSLKPETGIESIISRLSKAGIRVSEASERVSRISDLTLGYEGCEGIQDTPSPVRTSVADHLADLERAIERLEYQLRRLT